MAVSRTLRRRVLAAAGGRREYCQTQGWPLTVDHIVPTVRWRTKGPDLPALPFDPDGPANLAAACARCNRAKWDVTTARDPLTGREVPLFHPRTERWMDHFAWVADYQEIVGLTPTGRATVARPRLNRPIYRQQRALLRAATALGLGRWP